VAETKKGQRWKKYHSGQKEINKLTLGETTEDEHLWGWGVGGGGGGGGWGGGGGGGVGGGVRLIETQLDTG